MVVQDAVSDPRVSPLVDSHAHDGRWGLPGHDLLYSAVPTIRLRCAIDGKRARQGARCRISMGDSRLAEAISDAERAKKPRPGADDDTSPHRGGWEPGSVE